MDINMDYEKILNGLNDKRACFYFTGSSELINVLSNEDHPITKKLPKFFRKNILENNGLRISNKMVAEYYAGILDEDNKFILDSGYIRVLENKIVLPDSKNNN